MAEWSIAAVLKTVEGHTSGGSNPSLSAIYIDYQCITKFTHTVTHKTVNFDRNLTPDMNESPFVSGVVLYHRPAAMKKICAAQISPLRDTYQRK